MEYYEIASLRTNQTGMFRRRNVKERICVVQGSGRLKYEDAIRELCASRFYDIPKPVRQYSIQSRTEGAIVVRVTRRWGDQIGSSGVFTLDKCDMPANAGDPVAYPWNTDFDCHYHHCDEYWILVAGRGVVMTEHRLHLVEPGVCVATRMGTHTDFPLVYEKVMGVYFETTLRGRKRPGHLWTHTHWEFLIF